MSGINILVAEDKTDIKNLIVKYLENEGYSVYASSDVEHIAKSDLPYIFDSYYKGKIETPAMALVLQLHIISSSFTKGRFVFIIPKTAYCYNYFTIRTYFKNRIFYKISCFGGLSTI